MKTMRAERTRRASVCAALAVGVGFVARPETALAQSLYDRSENVAVTSRPHPEYDALGEHVGSFTMYPRVSLSGTYDDNIFALPNKTSGFIATVAPSVEFASNWTRNALDFRLRYERDEYVNRSSESSNEYSLSSTGRLDIDQASAISFRFDVARLTEPRTAPDSFFALQRPVRYDLVTAGANGYREFGRFRAELEVTNSFYSFFDSPLVSGGFYPESSRDETSTTERFRLSYAIGPNLAVFGQMTPNQSRFLHAPFNGFASFDSTGYSWLGGVNAQLTHLITVDAGVGLLSQSYDDPRISDVTGTAYNVDLKYFPTQILTVYLHANHSIQASGLPGTPASNVDSASVNADYEFRRNIIISPNASYARYRYPGTDRVDDRYGAGVNATYLINRTLGVTASYGFIKQSSNGGFGGADFDDNRLSLTLTLQR